MSTKEQKIVEEKPTAEAKVEPPWNITRVVYILLCTIGGLVVGHHYTQYSKQLHENDMWFSNIMEVEREISFRTEAGLYYSYYKQLVLAPTFSKGINDLIQDNKTEYLRTINILKRFNIYQEVVLAAIYRNLPISLKENWESIYFYLDSIYALNGMMMFSLFCSAGALSGNPAAGFLANAYFIFNRPHVTRLYKTAPLREHFSLPFIYLQLLLISLYFKNNLNKNIERLVLVGVGLATFSFNLAWQFSQFVMLLQMFALFGSYSLLTLDKRKVKAMIYVYMLSLGAVCTLMFGNDMLYTSLVASFCCAFLITLHLPIEDKYEGALRKIFLLVFRITFVLALTAVLNYATKTITDGESDSHVYNFVLTKFGFNNQEVKNFDVRLYLCNGGFDFMDVRYEAEALTEGMLFPSYAISISIALIAMLVSFLRSLRESSSTTNWMQEHPEVAYHIMLNMFFGLVAVSTQRMKFLWLPHVCVISAALLCNRNVWRAILEKVKIKGTLNWLMQQSLIAVLLGLLIQKKLPILQEELSGLYQFEDPDTVELMQWIKTNTRKDAAFTGSMQLLAGVKLCTDRPVTNHPHYENKFLRERTKQVYQIYAKRPPKDVHAILRQHGTSYIILENSICYSRLSCKLTANLDADTPNTSTARFCDAIKRGTRAFTRYFEKVFENRTFYMYRVKRIKSE